MNRRQLTAPLSIVTVVGLGLISSVRYQPANAPCEDWSTLDAIRSSNACGAYCGCHDGTRQVI